MIPWLPSPEDDPGDDAPFPSPHQALGPESPAPGLLVFEEKPRRKKTPRHLADIDTGDSAAVKSYAEELGVQGMRIKQLAKSTTRCYWSAPSPAALLQRPP